MNILIAGGSGYIGQYITSKLQVKGHKVSWLTRRRNKSLPIRQFEWDYTTYYFDAEALNDTDVVINLSGSPINGKRWTASYKKEIYASRILGTRFLVRQINNRKNYVHTFINGSAIGYYGYQGNTEVMDENHECGTGFLANTCLDWESEIKALKNDIRQVILRTGVVFNEGSQAYESMIKVIRCNLGSVLGSGKQYFNWIHIDDLANLFIYCIEQNELNGVYNAVAPVNMSLEEVMNSLAEKEGKKIWLPHTPAWFVKILFGELAHSLLNGNELSVERILKTGFQFKHPNL